MIAYNQLDKNVLRYILCPRFYLLPIVEFITPGWERIKLNIRRWSNCQYEFNISTSMDGENSSTTEHILQWARFSKCTNGTSSLMFCVNGMGIYWYRLHLHAFISPTVSINKIKHRLAMDILQYWRSNNMKTYHRPLYIRKAIHGRYGKILLVGLYVQMCNEPISRIV